VKVWGRVGGGKGRVGLIKNNKSENPDLAGLKVATKGEKEGMGLLQWRGGCGLIGYCPVADLA